MNTAYEVTFDEYMISTDISKLDLQCIHQFLSEESYWAKDITPELVKRSVEYSLNFGLYHSSHQIGFARVITDRTTFAYLADVFIIAAYRGRGLSKMLIGTIHTHPDLQQLRSWQLRTKDAHGLYEQFGWKRLETEQASRYMTISNTNIYQQLKTNNNPDTVG